MLKSVSILSAPLLLAAGALGQATTSVVIPSWNKATEGNAMELKPFAYDRCRLAHYIGPSLLKNQLPVNKRITEIAYRRDGTFLRTQTLQRTGRRGTVQPFWTIRMGTWLGDAKNPPSDYPCFTQQCRGNGPKVQVVMSSKKIIYPKLTGLSASNSAPGAFQIRFKLDSPFRYTGGALIIDHYVYEQRGVVYTQYLVDAERTNRDTGSFKSFGSSCPAANNRAYAIPSNPGGEPLSMLLFDGPPSSFAVAVLGASNTGWAQFKLPLDLSTGFGLKGCFLNVSVDVLSPQPTLTNGSAIFSVNVPADPRLAGAKVFGQWMNIDTRVSQTLPLTFSNGVEIKVGKSIGKGAGLDGSFVYGTQQNALVNGRFGFRDAGISLVTEITYQ